MKRLTTAAMALLLAVGTPAASFAAITFKDINDVPWSGAETYINRAGELGLMQGELTNGERYFRGRSSVTCFETVQLIYNLLKQTNNLTNTTGINEKWSYVLTQMGVPDWTKESLAYALEKGIVSVNDAKKFIGNALASREAVAVMVGKALTVKYSVQPSAVLSYADGASVNSGSVPYVELLNRLGIMEGDTSNKFNPKVAINRAEMAAVVSRAYDKLNSATGTGNNTPGVSTNTIENAVVVSTEDYGSSILCVIRSLSDSSITGLFVDSTTTVTNSGGGANSYKAITTGDTLNNVVHNAGTVTSVIITYDANPSTISGGTTVDGRIDEINNERVYLTKVTSSTNGYYFASNCKYYVDDKEVSQKSFIESADKYTMDVVLTLDNNGEVSKITAKTSEGSYKYGILESIDRDGIQVRRTTSSSRVDYDWADTGSVALQLEGKDSTISKIDNALSDDRLYVRYTLNSDGDVRRLHASTDNFEDDDDDDDEDIITGYFVSLTSSQARIKKTSSSSSDRYNLNKDCTFRLEGSSSTVSKINKAFEDAEDDDDDFYMKLELDSDGKVSRVWASEDKFKSSGSSSSSTKEYSGYADGITSSYLSFRRSSSSSFKEYDLAEDIVYRLDGSSANRSDIRSAINDEDELEMTIKLNSKDEVTRIEAETGSSSKSSGTRSGKLKELTSKYAVLKNNSTEHEFASVPTISLNGDDDASVSDINKYLKDSDVVVEATLTFKSGKVTKLEAVVTEMTGSLKSLRLNNGDLTLRTPDGNTYKVDFNRNKVEVKGDYKDIEDLDYQFNDRDRDIDVTITFDENKDMYALVIECERS